jgi:hypothetical protein
MSPRAAPALAGGLLSAALLAAAVLAAARPARAQPPAARAEDAGSGAYDFGATVVYRGCLRVSAFGYRDRQEDVDNHDWVRLRVENNCPRTVRNLNLQVLLYDGQGRAYGAPLWVLGRGEALRPGRHWEDDLAIPDPERRAARRWGVRVLRADGVPRAAAAPQAPPLRRP